jgi:anti-sigma factor RsiW
MNCAESRLLLHAHADGELDIVKGLELDRHLKTCPTCAGQKQSLHSLKAALRQSPLRYDAPASLRKEVLRMGRGRSGETQSRFTPLLLWKSLAFGATAFAILAILHRPGIPARDTVADEAVASHVRSLMVEHLTDVASGDQHTVKPWFNGKLDFAPEVKDFVSQGFPLVGGRLDYLNGRAVAALVYQRSKHLINVFVWPSASTGDGKLKMEKLRGYSIISHEVTGLRYCIVSDLNDKELVELANLFGK